MRLRRIIAAAAVGLIASSVPAAQAQSHHRTSTWEAKPCTGRHCGSDLCLGHRTTITTGPGAQIIKGTPGRDIINSGSGADIVVAGRGGDLICSGPGADIVIGGRGRDLILGGSERDICIAEEKYQCELP